jgi:class 3 adenylate cyclase/predicted ATPase
MRCSKCGSENPPKNKFCGECGSKLLPADQDRIDIVKKDIPESLVRKILLTKDTIAKERRDVTVIFADISGFTTMSEKLDPEEVTLLMNECFRKLGAMVYRYEGIIDKFLGDCIMAIFGAPVTHEDDPERAILACLDMQLAVNDINKNLNTSLDRLSIHSGINTGEVIAGKVGSDLQMDYTVMGDTVNVAQRLKDIAPRGSILVGSETYNRTKHAFDFTTSDPVQLKGKTELVKPFEVVGRKWGSEFGLSAVRSDLIGRDKELDELKKGYKKLTQKKSSIYIVKGEIGVGKSRLLYEFKKLHSLSEKNIHLIEGRGVSYESSNPLKCIADSLHHYLLASQQSRMEVSNKELQKSIQHILGDEFDEAAPYLFKLFNIPLTKKQEEKIIHLDGHALQLQIFLAITTLLERISEQQPLLVVFDDIQWTDSTSLELLNFLIPIVKNHSIAFYLSYRIGDTCAIEKFLHTLSSDFKDYVKEVELKNLDDKHSTLLVQNLIGRKIPAKVMEFIISKSDGNPFFIEEIVRRIIESGVLDTQEEITEKDIQVPGSIDAAITSRIDNLSKEAKYLLKISAIIGRAFPQQLLEEVVTEKDVYQHVGDLEKAEFLIKIIKNNETHYAFRHALFQEVAYHSLLKSERTIYHKIIAETIENKFKDRIDNYNATLANHYHNCKNIEKTIEYAIKAGDEANELFANDEALVYYHLALLAAEHKNVKKLEVLEKIADIEMLTGRVDCATEHFQEAKNYTDDNQVLARLDGKIAKIILQTGKVDDGIVLMREALRSIEGSNTAVAADIKYQLADALAESKAELTEAEQLIDDGIAIARSIDNSILELDGKRIKAHVLWRAGKTEKALRLLDENLQAYKKEGGRRYLPNLYIIMGVFYRALGDLQRAIILVQQAIQLSQEIGNQRLLSIGYNNLGIYYDLLGDSHKSIAQYEKNLEIKKRIHDQKGMGIGYLNIGVLKARMGELKEGLTYFMKAKEVFEKVNDIRAMFNTYSTIGSHLEKLSKKKVAKEGSKYN